jgi:hypothetical protein
MCDNDKIKEKPLKMQTLFRLSCEAKGISIDCGLSAMHKLGIKLNMEQYEQLCAWFDYRSVLVLKEFLDIE